MNGNDITRYGKRFVQYFWDPMPTNESSEPIWCLGRKYEIKDEYHGQIRHLQTKGDYNSTASIDSSAHTINPSDSTSIDVVDRTESAERDEALAKGWPAAFLDDLESRIWLTYRSNFYPIARAADPNALTTMSFSARLKQLGNQGGFTSDTGWGCMIRSGQSLLANALITLEMGRDWRSGTQSDKEQSVLALFADDPSAPFSIHRFVEHGASSCGKHPGEWFGPSATARCIRELVTSHQASNLKIYVRPDDSDVYEDSLLKIAKPDHDSTFQPTLILLGTRLGIDRINPVYYNALSRVLTSKTAIGIAGGRPSSSHYFFGVQDQSYFYLDPHFTRPFLQTSPTKEDIASCHTRKLRRIQLDEMDPSMLIGFLVRDETDWQDWKREIRDMEAVRGIDGKGKQIVHLYDTEPVSGLDNEITGREGQRESAIDDVVSCDEEEELQ